jgi:hypothetical protein
MPGNDESSSVAHIETTVPNTDAFISLYHAMDDVSGQLLTFR